MYRKYQRLILEGSNDGINWVVQEPRQYKAGEVIEEDSKDCGGYGGVTQNRWVEILGEYLCINNDKYQKLKKQYLDTATGNWVDVEPLETMEGELIEKNSEQCGYAEQWVDTGEWGCKEVDEYNQLFLSTLGYGNITAVPSQTSYRNNSVVTMTAVPSEGYNFKYYEYGMTPKYELVSQETDNPLMLIMLNSWYVRAVFEEKPIVRYFNVYPITEGNGTISVAPSYQSYASGEFVNVTHLPSNGYMFKHYEYGSTAAYGSTTTSKTLKQEITNDFFVKAVFIERPPIPTSGSLYYSYSNGKESWYNWGKSTLSYQDNNGYQASIIIDYSGVLTSIPSMAFYRTSYSYQSMLRKISFPNVSYVSQEAFLDNTGLSDIYLPELRFAGRAAFDNTRMEVIDFPYLEYISSFAFRYCRNLSFANIPNATTLMDEAFAYCSVLADVNMPNVVTTSRGAFAWDSYLTNIDMPNCTLIGDNTFYQCSRISTVNAPNVITISSGAFYSCTLLQSVNIPNAEVIGSSAFAYCSSLLSLTLPKASRIWDGAFRNALNFTTLILPSDSVCFIHSSAFINAPTNIFVPESLLSIYKRGAATSYLSSRFYPIEA